MSESTIKHVRRFKNLKTGESFVVEMEINIDEVCRHLAARAIGSKSGKSVALNGDIKCKVINATSPVG
jgi:hypothetical protein